ncbi:methionine adenosyltransferase [Culicoidibacter larvae]|uniref:S-adenosylmethionine synthase n=1 Tax=Culicoidibacter larvae TaxID=2579976 RepID=A0A5R8QA61_9FIRM|nr:methionine adenosyltransferase [Culicoidibacter larvae]TLG72481.1 methionine adenosyltransferase [Culicoidibacter larvae]
MVEDKLVFTSESVSEGHPDKICDQISDAILDAYLAVDSHARVACEVLVTTNLVIIAGEASTHIHVDVEDIARKKLLEIGYTDEAIGMDGNTCEVRNYMHEQSVDIAQGVDSETEKASGAGDQGIMFGFATNETESLMPLPIVIAHELVHRASLLRKSGAFKHARPDMKSQVTIDYTDAGHPKVDTLLMSVQHDDDYNHEEFCAYIRNEIMKPVVEQFGFTEHEYRVLINPTGRFVIGGPHGDTGLTGRKIIVDTYGGYARHGGGAFSGKDASKVDRSAAYAARYIAKNVVAAGFADKCEVQLSYAIGVAEPTSIFVETFGTETVAHKDIVAAIRQCFDLRPSGIIAMLGLTEPIFGATAAYGHFGRTDVDLPWERLNKVAELRKSLNE